MKGFPNQTANLEKLAVGMRTLLELAESNEDAKGYGFFGQALVRTGVAGTGHTPMPVANYIRQQLTNPIAHLS